MTMHQSKHNTVDVGTALETIYDHFDNVVGMVVYHPSDGGSICVKVHTPSGSGEEDKLDREFRIPVERDGETVFKEVWVITDPFGPDLWATPTHTTVYLIENASRGLPLDIGATYIEHKLNNPEAHYYRFVGSGVCANIHKWHATYTLRHD